MRLDYIRCSINSLSDTICVLSFFDTFSFLVTCSGKITRPTMERLKLNLRRDCIISAFFSQPVIFFLFIWQPHRVIYFRSVKERGKKKKQEKEKLSLKTQMWTVMEGSIFNVHLCWEQWSVNWSPRSRAVTCGCLTSSYARWALFFTVHCTNESAQDCPSPPLQCLFQRAHLCYIFRCFWQTVGYLSLVKLICSYITV